MPSDSSNFTRFARFHTTRWSVVVGAQSRIPGATDASLESLCRQYWPPLYAYVRSRGHPPHDAQDLTQGFFARMLEKDWLAAADRNQGKLRSFLLTAMKRFLANEWERSHAAKRGGLHDITSMDTEEGERLLASAATLPEEPAFDRAWAHTVLKSTLRRLRSEYEQAGKLREYERIKPSLTAVRGEIDYDAIAADLRVLPASARSLVHRLRMRFRELFREEVAGTVAAPEEIDDEMRALVAALDHI
jgi:DNA-directed RNA polymerase specialized sigma24 family protein